MEFLDPSNEAVAPVNHLFSNKYDFPFDLVPVGKSFLVTKDEVKNSSVLRTTASRYGKKLGKQFRVIDHGDTGFEVYRKS